MRILMDTTYILPLIKISIHGLNKKVLQEVLSKHDVYFSNISIFELMAKGAKYVANRLLDPEDIILGVKAILDDERIKIVDFESSEEILELGIKVRLFLNDFIDCILTSTALVKADVFLTEDSEIHSLANNKEFIKLKSEINPKLKIVSVKQFMKTKNILNYK